MDTLINVVDVDKDVGNLSISNYNKIAVENLGENTENYLLSLNKDNTQLLINDIFSLETERKDNELIVKLPKICTSLPRARTMPKQKVPTKWQQFAKEKGIKNKKKPKLNWDEELTKWIPTFGYKKNAAEYQKNWVVELTTGDTPRETRLSSAKSEKIAKNELQRLRNLARAKKIAIPRVGLPATEFASGKQLAVAKTLARLSTASAGKFQNRLPKEKDANNLAKSWLF
ncbi:hypothetical protein HCN44_006886 [Aphidius gifuensis]|uniref:Ribosome biogenesis regulatory protein n=1 Tax=Aphidius gifuensis TaxID=684658 RepID=A0A835CU57_APHGI|nr:ribosome biogenesis regulatory protein homolog [Aphidius gifuensis]KAF7995779.1 hypothetical protein HCN44_006886 [Aphidius gifuensis]